MSDATCKFLTIVSPRISWSVAARGFKGGIPRVELSTNGGADAYDGNNIDDLLFNAVTPDMLPIDGC
jgi:hypothetical protein